MTRLIVLAILQMFVTSANAGVVLLGTFGGVVANGRLEVPDPRAQLGLAFGEVVTIDGILAPSSFMQDGEIAVFDFSAENEAFGQIAQLATNGIDDRVQLFFLWPDILPAIVRGDYESAFFGRDVQSGETPDLVGGRVELIQLVVSEVTMEPFLVNDREGVIASFDYRYDFYGTPIPEPTTLSFLFVALSAVLAQRT